MTLGRRLRRVEGVLRAVPGALCAACGLAADRVVVLRDSYPVAPGADCPACRHTRQTIRISRIIVAPTTRADDDQ